MLKGFLCVAENGTVISKQQLSDEFFYGFYACKKMPKVEETAACSRSSRQLDHMKIS